MSSILSIAVSGLAAASERLQDSASNVANAESDGPASESSSQSTTAQTQYPPAYTPKQVHQIATPGGGTKALTTDVQPATVLASDPNAPYADQNGEVAKPNVDFTSEAYQQLTARYDFVMNAYVARVYSRMMKSLVDINT